MSKGIRFREQSQRTPPVKLGRYSLVQGGIVNNSESFDLYTDVSATTMVRRTWDETHPGPPYREGGPFTSVYGEYPVNQLKGGVNWRYPREGTTYRKYVGGFAPTGFPDGATEQQINALGLSLPYSKAWFDASAYGNEAYLSARPKLAKTDLAVAIGELKDLPGMLKTSAKGFHDLWKDFGGETKSMLMQPKTVADHFLNHQFGWVPFVNDIVKTYDTYQNQAKYLDQLAKDNGVWKKRYRSILDSDVTTSVGRSYYPAIQPYDTVSFMMTPRTIDGHPCRGLTDTILRAFELVWFVGSFKFYRPEFDPKIPWENSWYGKINRLITLYGLRVNPSTIYKLTPWTWLADWFGNAGKIIDYVSSQAYDGVVSQNAFVMRHKIEMFTHSYQLFYDDDTITLQYPHFVDCKNRGMSASPYGFDVHWADLSPERLAILAALGITRA